MIELLLPMLLSAAPPAELHTVEVAVTDESGAAPTGLVPEEVVVIENGVARDVARVERDERPLRLAVLVDSSQTVGTAFRMRIVDAVAGFLERLPPGSHYTLWTTGDRPEKRVGPTDDPGLGLRSLQRVAPQGGNTILDAIVYATRELKVEEGERSVIVVVTGRGIEFSNRDRFQVVHQALPGAQLFEAVQFQEGDADQQMQINYGYVLDAITKRTGGRLERPVSVMGVDTALRRISGDIAGRHRISYATLGDLDERKVEVQVARPGAEVRLIPPREAPEGP
jgi:von Willebrand factor type A domain